MKTEIIVTFQVEGFHFWKNAPDEVAFLRDNHRHIFHITAYKEVSHSDRDIEFILLKREMKKQFPYEPFQFGEMSCEMIASALVKVFDLSACEVWEDKENGAIVRK